ncbi:protein FAM131C isoform X2 [Desmodus rotundus]|uniref:protein FAM131C isoform X2 n=1 Tax=Desmodus rotundus TaxID=9430 RepID=UPI00238174A2|nr:protein FAM131C isoform X2 [Desmodus rotundus]
MGSCVSRDLFTSVHKDCPMPQATDPLSADLPSSLPPTIVPDYVTGKDKQMDFCWDPWQRCFQTTNGYLSGSRSCSSNYNVAALATSSLVGVVQSIKDHITKPTAMARGRVAHLIEWKGWSAQRSGWELSPAEQERYCHLPDELREARFAAGVAEQFAITEATLSAWSSLDDEELHPENDPRDIVQLQDLDSIYLQDSPLSGPSQDDSLLAFSPRLSPDSWPSPEEPPIMAAAPQPPSPEQQHRRRLPGGPGPEGGAGLQSSPPSVDSGSLSEEDEALCHWQARGLSRYQDRPPSRANSQVPRQQPRRHLGDSLGAGPGDPALIPDPRAPSLPLSLCFCPRPHQRGVASSSS